MALAVELSVRDCAGWNDPDGQRAGEHRGNG